MNEISTLKISEENLSFFKEKCNEYNHNATNIDSFDYTDNYTDIPAHAIDGAEINYFAMRKDSIRVILTKEVRIVFQLIVIQIIAKLFVSIIKFISNLGSLSFELINFSVKILSNISLVSFNFIKELNFTFIKEFNFIKFGDQKAQKDIKSLNQQVVRETSPLKQNIKVINRINNQINVVGMFPEKAYAYSDGQRRKIYSASQSRSSQIHIPQNAMRSYLRYSNVTHTRGKVQNFPCKRKFRAKRY